MSEEMIYLPETRGNRTRSAGSRKGAVALREQVFQLLDHEKAQGAAVRDVVNKHFIDLFMKYVGFNTTNRLELISQLREGVSYSSIKTLADFTETPASELSGFISISVRTLDRRRKAGKLNPDETEKVYRLASLVARAAEVLESREEANHWLKTPKKALGGQIPFDLADTEVGADEVKALLTRIEHGVFS